MGLLSLDSSDIASIKSAIVQKAECVFLWVSLVLGSVEDGLFSGDSISELVCRIAHCPVELEASFETFLKSIHPADRKFAFPALRWISDLQRHKQDNNVERSFKDAIPLEWGFDPTLDLNLVELSSLETTESDLWALQFEHGID